MTEERVPPAKSVSNLDALYAGIQWKVFGGMVLYVMWILRVCAAAYMMRRAREYLYGWNAAYVARNQLS